MTPRIEDGVVQTSTHRYRASRTTGICTDSVGCRVRYLLIRHAQARTNAAGRHLGSSDSLSTVGRRQAALLAARLAPFNLDTIVHSGSVRTAETVDILLTQLHTASVVSDVLLREGEVGAWVGEPIGMRNRLAEQGTPLWKVRPPGGESYLDIDRRIFPFVEKLIRGHYGDFVAIIGHGRVNSLILRRLEGTEWPDYEARQMSHTGVTDFEIGPNGFVVHSREDVSHLTPDLVTI
jgi:broad specificity phosphatase PhoE